MRRFKKLPLNVLECCSLDTSKTKQDVLTTHQNVDGYYTDRFIVRLVACYKPLEFVAQF